MIRRVAIKSVQVGGRLPRFSTAGSNLTTAGAAEPLSSSAVTKPIAPVAPLVPTDVPVKLKTSTLSQRINAFLFGTGLGFAIGSYMVFEELSESNQKLEEKLASIHDRMDIIESAK